MFSSYRLFRTDLADLTEPGGHWGSRCFYFSIKAQEKLKFIFFLLNLKVCIYKYMTSKYMTAIGSTL